MNAMTSYAIAHSNPSTTQEEEDSLNYVHKELDPINTVAFGDSRDCLFDGVHHT